MVASCAWLWAQAFVYLCGAYAENEIRHIDMYIDSIVYYSTTQAKVESTPDTWQTLYRSLVESSSYCLPSTSEQPFRLGSPCGWVKHQPTNLTADYVHWNITAHQSTQLNVSFSHFLLFDSLYQCGTEALEFTCYTGSGKAITHRYCGRKEPWEAHCNGNALRLTYEGDMGKTNTAIKTGFKFSYQAAQGKQQFTHTKYILLAHMENGRRSPKYLATLDTLIQNWFPILCNRVSEAASPVVDLIFEVITYVTVTINLVVSSHHDCIDILVRDGPFLTSPFLTPTNTLEFSTYTSSGFMLWITMQINKSRCEKNQLESYSLKYTTHEDGAFDLTNMLVPNTPLVFKMDGLVTPGGSNNGKKFAMNGAWLHNYDKEFLNITIEDLHSSLPSSDDCRYWGIVIRHLPNSALDEMPGFYNIITDPILMLCKVIQGPGGDMVPIPRRFVSHYPQVLVWWYTYTTDAQPFQAVLKVSKTPCSGIHTYCGPPEAISHIPEAPSLYQSAVHGSIPNIDESVGKFPNNVCNMKQTDSDNLAQIAVTNAALCVIRRNRKLIMNRLSPLLSATCVVLQHLPYYSYWKPPSERCQMRLKIYPQHEREHPTYQTDESTELKASVYLEDARRCQNVMKRITVVETYTTEDDHTFTTIDITSSHQVYSFDPTCGEVALHASKIVRHGMVQVPARFDYGNFIQYVASSWEKNERYFALHHKVDLQQRVYIADNALVLKTFQFGGFWFYMRDKTAGVELRSFAEEIQHLTTLNVTFKNASVCVGMCVELSVFTLVPFTQGDQTSEQILVHKRKQLFCPENNASQDMVSLALYAFRYILLTPLFDTYENTKPCPITLNVNPYVPMHNLIRPMYRYDDGSCCEPEVVKHVVIWQYQRLSRNEAQDICHKISRSNYSIDKLVIAFIYNKNKYYK